MGVCMRMMGSSKSQNSKGEFIGRKESWSNKLISAERHSIIWISISVWWHTLCNVLEHNWQAGQRGSTSHCGIIKNEGTWATTMRGETLLIILVLNSGEHWRKRGPLPGSTLINLSRPIISKS